MSPRVVRATAAAVVTAAAVLFPAGWTAGYPGGGDGEPAGAETAAGDDAGLARLQVVESLGVAAVMGVVTRVPAESPGGGAYTETHITPVKALGRAAGAYPGPLGEAFLGTSLEAYHNPTMVVAQQPAGLFPAEAQVESGQAGPYGTVGLIRAAAASRSEVTAEVVMGAGPPDAPIRIEGGTSRSHSLVEPDGTVVTEVTTTFGRIEVGDVLEMAGGASRALARTPPGGEPVLELDSTLGQLTLNGVGARLGDDGLVIADAEVASPADLAQFNAGLAQLRQAGVFLEAVPGHREQAPGNGRITGAAGLFRYQLPSNPIPNSIGNDQEFLLAQVSAAAVAVPHPDGAAPDPLPPVDLPGIGVGLEGSTADGRAVPAGEGPGAPGLLPLPAPATGTAAGGPVLSPGGGTPAAVASAAPGPVAPLPPEGAASPGGQPAGDPFFDAQRLALPASADRSLVASVTGFYAVLVFLAGAAVLILLGLHKARAA